MRVKRYHHAFAALMCIAVPGCFAPELSNGGLSCSSDGHCPPAYHCASDSTCWKNGEDPSTADMSVGDVSGDLGPAPDLMATMTALGQPCQVGSNCASGFCVDGVCCDSACGGSCQACNVPNSVGACTKLPAGATPATGHPSCGPDAKSSCMRDGTCDGAGNCHLWNNVVCKAGSCDPTANQATGPSKCDGAGTCVTPNAVSCGPYVCLPDNTACYPSCSGTATGCKSPNTCNAGSCGPKPSGTPCASGTECATGNCSPDGYCCDTACTGKCEACDVGVNRGTCTAITSGEPEQSHGGDCSGFGVSACGGACAAGNRATCSFPGDGTVTNVTCSTTSCKDTATQYNSAQCNGSGACKTPTTMSCGAYACIGNACQTSCGSDDSSCARADFCSGSSCVPGLANGQACTRARQCASGNCVDGYCCNMPCNGNCQRCDATPGTCTPTANGTSPVNGRSPCGTDTRCYGTCDGNGSCGNFNNTVSCRNAQCSGSDYTKAATCDGAGNCPPPVTGTCDSAPCCSGAICAPPHGQCPG